MKQYRRLFIALAIFMSGLALIPYVSLSSEPFGWQMFADVYEPEVPTLDINFTNGRPGSFFTLAGSNFPPDDTATVLVNSNALGSVNTDAKGELMFILSTSNAEAGFYLVTATGNPDASTSFQLDPDAPLRAKDGTVPEFEVPAGSAFTEFVYLPLVLR